MQTHHSALRAPQTILRLRLGAGLLSLVMLSTFVAALHPGG